MRRRTVTFIAKERFILKKDIIASVTFEIENAHITKEFTLQKNTWIVIQTAAPMSGIYTFTLEALQTIMQFSDGKPLVFSVSKDTLHQQRVSPQTVLALEDA